MMEAYLLSVYEKAMPDSLCWQERLTAVRNSGFDAVELSIDESPQRLSRLEWPMDKRLELLRRARDTGVALSTMCLSAHRKYSLGGQDTANEGLEIFFRAVRLACDLGIRIIQLAGYDVYYEPSTSQTATRFEANLKICVDYASANGVALGFETMETPFLNTVAKAMRYVRKVGSPYLQIYPDIGNLSNASVDVNRDLHCADGHILAVHLKETRPTVFRDLFYGDGCVNFEAILPVLWRMGIRLYNAEFWYDGKADWQQRLANANQFLRSYLDVLCKDEGHGQ